MDILDLDSGVLRAAAATIKGYCDRQAETMDNFLNGVRAREAEWSDDMTMGKLINEVENLRATVTAIMEEIRNTYPPYFEKKADQIDSLK